MNENGYISIVLPCLGAMLECSVRWVRARTISGILWLMVISQMVPCVFVCDCMRAVVWVCGFAVEQLLFPRRKRENESVSRDRSNVYWNQWLGQSDKLSPKIYQSDASKWFPLRKLRPNYEMPAKFSFVWENAFEIIAFWKIDRILTVNGNWWNCEWDVTGG